MTETGVTIVDFEAMTQAISAYQQKSSAISGIVQALQATQAALSAANVFTGGAATSVMEAIATYINVLNQAIDKLDALEAQYGDPLPQDKLDEFLASVDKRRANTADPVLIDEIDSFFRENALAQGTPAS